MTVFPAFFIMLCIALLLGWGVGSLMATIGKIQGWNTKRTFWISFTAYMLLLIVIYATAAAELLPSDEAIYILIGLLIAGTLSPILNLMVKWLYRETLSRAVSDRAVPSDQNKVSPPPRQPPAAPVNGLQPKPGHASEAGSSRIFMSYRRSDSADISGRIYDRLTGKFGRVSVFKDVDSIPLGIDFKNYLDKKVSECSVFLVIIGSTWTEARDQTGKRRLDDPTDFVRIEVESALERGIPVIPLLVQNAQMPVEENLPPSLRRLVYRNGIQIRSDPDFHHDMDRLIFSLEKYI